MTKNMLQKKIEGYHKGNGIDEVFFDSKYPNIKIEFEYEIYDDFGKYIPPKDQVLHSILIEFIDTGAISQVRPKDYETFDKFLEKVARTYNKFSKLYGNKQ